MTIPFHGRQTYKRNLSSDLEPPIGIEPMTYALREARNTHRDHYLHRSPHMRPGMLPAHSMLQIPGHDPGHGPPALR